MANIAISSTSLVLRRAGSLANSAANAFAVLQRREYHEKVIDHYENPRNVGKLDAKKSNVGTGLVGAPACGDVMKLQVEVHFGVFSFEMYRVTLANGKGKVLFLT